MSLGVSDPFTPVVLTSGGVVREKAHKDVIRIYEYASAFPFKLHIAVVLGQVDLRVVANSSTSLFSQVLTASSEVTIENPDGKYTLYEITIRVISTSVYAMQVVGDQGTRLIEGYSLSQQFEAGKKARFHFSSAHSQTVNLVLFVEDPLQNNDTSAFPTIEVEVSAVASGQEAKVQVELGYRSGNMLTYAFEAQPAEYSIGVSLSTSRRAAVLLTRRQMTYLPENTPLISNGGLIFDIDTRGTPVMVEVFPCSGTIVLVASEEYSVFEDNSSSKGRPVILEHNNIAGHYVVSSSSTAPEYYAQVQGPLFRISYSRILGTLPYKHFLTVNYNMEYVEEDYGFKVSLELPLPPGRSPLGQLKARYEVIYGRNRADVYSYGQCLLAVPVVTLHHNIEDYPPQSGTSSFSFPVTNEALDQIFTAEVNPLYLGVRLMLDYSLNGTDKTLVYVYEPLEMMRMHLTKDEDTPLSWVLDFLLWGLIFLAVLAIALAAARWCWANWKNYRGVRGYFLQEDEEVPTSSFQGMEGQKKEEDVAEEA
jgi:hypothetical protein